MPTCESMYEAILKMHREISDCLFITIVMFYILKPKGKHVLPSIMFILS